MVLVIQSYICVCRIMCACGGKRKQKWRGGWGGVGGGGLMINTMSLIVWHL